MRVGKAVEAGGRRGVGSTRVVADTGWDTAVAAAAVQAFAVQGGQ